MLSYLSLIITAFIAEHPSFTFLKADTDFIKIADESVVLNSVERITLYVRPIEEVAVCGCTNKAKPCFYIARGNFLNFLRVNNTIILPEYNLSTKKLNIITLLTK